MLSFPKVLVPAGVVLLLAAHLLAAGASDFKPRVEFGAKLEPRNHILHGAGQDPAGFDAYRAAFDAQHQPTVFMTYIGLCNPTADVVAWEREIRAEMDALEPYVVTPQIGLNLTGGHDDGTGQDAAVAAGRYDGNLEIFADALAELHRPVFIRIGYEFDGSWNNYHPATFVAAWKHITASLRRRRIPFATVWCAAGASSGWPALSELLKFYPGDDEVDWWGVDVFSPDEFAKPQLAAFLDAAAAHRKPVMLGETTPRFVGVLDGEKSWDRWFQPMLDLLRARPEIKAVDYINWDWAEWSHKLGFHWEDWGDARLSSNAYVREHWVHALKDPIFQHAESRRHQPTPLRP